MWTSKPVGTTPWCGARDAGCSSNNSALVSCHSIEQEVTHNQQKQRKTFIPPLPPPIILALSLCHNRCSILQFDLTKKSNWKKNPPKLLKKKLKLKSKISNQKFKSNLQYVTGALRPRLFPIIVLILISNKTANEIQLENYRHGRLKTLIMATNILLLLELLSVLVFTW